MTTALFAPVDDATRRQFLGAAALAALVAGCANPAPPADPSPATTRTFRDALGADVEIPVRPERIVVLDDTLAGWLLPLGGRVIGMPVGGAFRENYFEELNLSEITGVGGIYEPDLEAIAALRPDLLVEGVFEGETFIEPSVRGQLERFAPFVALDIGTDVEDATTVSVELLGAAVTVDPDSLRSEYETALGELRDVLGERWADTTVAMVDYRGPDAIRLYDPTTGSYVEVLNAVGVRWSGPQTDRAALGSFGELSAERLGELDADLIFVITAFAEGGRITEIPTFTRLPAAAAGQVVEIDRSFTATGYPFYAAYARYLVERLLALGDIRTDLVE